MVAEEIIRVIARYALEYIGIELDESKVGDLQDSIMQESRQIYDSEDVPGKPPFARWLLLSAPHQIGERYASPEIQS